MSRPERIRAKKAKIAAARRRAGYNDADDRVVPDEYDDYFGDAVAAYAPLADVEAKKRDKHRSRITMGGSGRPG